MSWVELIKEEELYLRVDLQARLVERGGYLDLEGLYLYVMEHPALLISRSADKLKSSRVVSAELADCFWEVSLQGMVKLRVPKKAAEIGGCEFVGLPYYLTD